MYTRDRAELPLRQHKLFVDLRERCKIRSTRDQVVQSSGFGIIFLYMIASITAKLMQCVTLAPSECVVSTSLLDADFIDENTQLQFRIVALNHTICTYTSRTYTYICYMVYRTLDLRYTLHYILIRVLYHTKLQTLFTTSSYRGHSSMLTTYCN